MRRKPVPKSQWVYYGYAGHYCCSPWCRFHLTTKVGKYLVSTVGAYYPPHSPDKQEEIGLDRYYETMVFRAGDGCSKAGCGCGLPCKDGSELDMEGYQTAGEATKGHRRLCLKWSRK